MNIDLRLATHEAWRVSTSEQMTIREARAMVTAAAPEIGKSVALAIETRQIVCPVHHMTGCSPLLNGCSLPVHLAEQRSIDARIAREATS